MNRHLLLLATSLLLCSGCASWPTSDEIDRWKAGVEKTVAAGAIAAERVNAGLEAVKSAQATVEAKIDELKVKHAATVADVEALGGPLDRDGDGDVTLGEAKAVYEELKKTPEGQSLLMNPEVYAAVLASVLGIGMAKKPAAALLAKVHSTGRALVDRDGDGKPDA